MENPMTEKYLLFSAGERYYAVPLKFTREILRMVTFHPVSELPPFVLGVINLRGYMLPVIDFQQRAGLGKTAITVRTRIIVLRLESILTGLAVDQVHEVIDIRNDQISEHIQPDVVLSRKYIAGMAVYRERWITLVDMNCLMTDKESQWLTEHTNEQSLA